MTNIHFVRHGFCLGNVGHYTGNPVDFTLSDEYCPLEKTYGIKQVKEAGRYLSEILNGKKVLFLTSPYYRTRQTLHYILKELSSETEPTVILDKNLREINQGLQYNGVKPPKPEDFTTDEEYIEFNNLPPIDQEIAYRRMLQREYAKEHNTSGEYISYLQGDSRVDIRNRVRVFAKTLKDADESGKYDDIVVISHNTIINLLYELSHNGEKMRDDFLTGSVLSIVNGEERSFSPITFVPKDFVVNSEDYENYRRMLAFQKLVDVDSKRHDLSILFGDRDLSMPLEEECGFLEKPGEKLILLPGTTDSKCMLFIDTTFGQDEITHDMRSTSTYYVMDGEGTFYFKGLNEEEFKTRNVSSSSGENKIVIPNNTVFYYESNLDNPLKLLKVMTPKYEQANVIKDGITPAMQRYEAQNHMKK